MPRFTFRFGELNKRGTETRPELNLTEIENSVEDKEIEGEKGDRRWASKLNRGPDSIYFELISETPLEYQSLSDDNRIVSEEVDRIKGMHFILFENGLFGFESRKGIHYLDALKYIFPEYDDNYESNIFDNLDLDTMRSFYKGSHEVRKLKADNIGERPPNPRVTDKELKEITEDTGLRTKSITASVGRAKENLQKYHCSMMA